MSINWFEHTRMSPARQAVYEAMEREDEGLGPRAFRTLLQVGDGDPRLHPADAAWLFYYDDEGPPLVEWAGITAGYRLSAFGRTLFDAADRGDWKAIARQTTNPNIDGVLN